MKLNNTFVVFIGYLSPNIDDNDDDDDVDEMTLYDECAKNDKSIRTYLHQSIFMNNRLQFATT